MIYIAKTSNSVSCHDHLPMLICVVGLVLSSTSCRPGWRRSPAWGTQSIQASTRTPRLRGLASPAVQRLSINNSAIRSSTLCHTSIGCSSPGSSRSRFTVSDWGRTMPLQCSQRMSEVERGTARKLLFDLKRYWHHNLTSEFLQVHDPTAQPFPYADLGLYDFTGIDSEDRADHMMSTKAHKTREPVNKHAITHPFAFPHHSLPISSSLPYQSPATLTPKATYPCQTSRTLTVPKAWTREPRPGTTTTTPSPRSRRTWRVIASGSMN